MINDITPAIAKSDIKPELQHVRVVEKHGGHWAVATDSFLMAWASVPKEIPEGWYTKTDWKTICKASKKDGLKEALAPALLKQELYKNFNTIDYFLIIDKVLNDKEKKQCDHNLGLDFFVKMIGLIKTYQKDSGQKHLEIDLKDILAVGPMATWSTEMFGVALMKLSK